MTVLATVNLLLTSVCGFPLASLAAGENKSVTPATNENTSTNTVGTNSALTNGVSQKDSAPYTLTPKENGVQEMLLANGLKVLLLEEHAFPVDTSMVV